MYALLTFRSYTSGALKIIKPHVLGLLSAVGLDYVITTNKHHHRGI